MNWDEQIAAVSPHVVKIATPSGHGTGFLAFYSNNGDWCGIATAAHVVAHADEWEQPIRITHDASGTSVFYSTEGRVIFVDKNTDSAIVLCHKRELKLPESPIALLPMEQPCGLGVEVGWLGYPGILPNNLCFFSGKVSARLDGAHAYLIDGVAINGVSGGPVFHHSPSEKKIHFIGCISAYVPNRATGETLPGLLRAQDVSEFHSV
ncbi:MAG: serine protease, partial [Hyphomicrobium sp.]